MAVVLTEHERLFALPPKIWTDIYERLGMENRFVSRTMAGRNFVLWTIDGHRIVFIPYVDPFPQKET